MEEVPRLGRKEGRVLEDHKDRREDKLLDRIGERANEDLRLGKRRQSLSKPRGARDDREKNAPSCHPRPSPKVCPK